MEGACLPRRFKIKASQSQHLIFRETQYPYRPESDPISPKGIVCCWVKIGAGIETMAQAIYERHQRLSGIRFDISPAVPQQKTKPFPAQSPPQPSAFPFRIIQANPA